jgi:hypothetical protein
MFMLLSLSRDGLGSPQGAAFFNGLAACFYELKALFLRVEGWGRPC